MFAIFLCACVYYMTTMKCPCELIELYCTGLHSSWAADLTWHKGDVPAVWYYPNAQPHPPLLAAVLTALARRPAAISKWDLNKQQASHPQHCARQFPVGPTTCLVPVLWGSRRADYNLARWSLSKQSFGPHEQHQWSALPAASPSVSLVLTGDLICRHKQTNASLLAPGKEEPS